jgi:death on curing protein
VGEPIWAREDVAIAIHRRQLAEHGGRDGIRDCGLLSAAMARPPNLLADSEGIPDLAALAAAYACGIARQHPFVDGNKRTAWVVSRTFLKLNGHDLKASQEEKYRVMMNLAAGRLSESLFVDWIRAHREGKPSQAGKR